MTKTEIINQLIQIRPKLMKYRGRLYSTSREKLFSFFLDIERLEETKECVGKGEKIVGNYRLLNYKLFNVFKLYGNMLISMERVNESLQLISLLKYGTTLSEVYLTDNSTLIGSDQELVDNCVGELINDLKEVSGYSKITYRKILTKEKNYSKEDEDSPCIIFEGC